MFLHHFETGSQNPTTLIFLHGGGLGGWMWRPHADHLSKFHCIIPDLPEHRGSVHKGIFSIPNAAEHIAEIIKKKAHGNRAHVIGLDLGGQVALQLSAIAPKLVESVLVSGVCTKPSLTLKWMSYMHKFVLPIKHHDWLIRAKMNHWGIPMKHFDDVQKDIVMQDWSSSIRIARENLGFQIPEMASHQKLPPLLALAGEKEGASIQQSLLELCASYPSSKSYFVRRAKHNWPLEKPALFCKTISSWIAGHPLPEILVSANPN
ncbi:Pimeloyl-ACP methyl ester carboxylesterase [Paenibacillus sp. yr247]|uniref:alpha/beta fold hydrolase n=1 Tax=Paenibacillus sp. yr247 TaxID=1761880 RepID=UPI0008921B5F|nr:alpha/beta hydrolase [Paenibacillus sp. yr247]SDN42874.1 Pimeloyl-ACP methyl ester carboxylesterase [Paenibacillus sp. yr247]